MSSSTETAVLAGQVDEDSVYFEGDGHTLLGRGTLRSWQVPQEDLRAGWSGVRDVLRRHDTVAFVSFPFDRAEPATVRVPAELAWAGPNGWIRPPAEDPRVDKSSTVDNLDVDTWQVRSPLTPRQWCAAVDTAVDRINAGELTKVVLSRRIVVERPAPFAPGPVLAALRARFPGTYLFSANGLVGASPELLVGADTGELFALPLAGTVGQHADKDDDDAARAAMVASAKLTHEHGVSRSEVLELFGEICATVKVDDEPVVVSTGSVHHLATPVRGVPRPGAPDLLTVAARMHPTSAVCGYPRQAAYDVIRELEPDSRGGYTGAVGWIDAEGNGRFAVAIRCVELAGRRAVIRVGNGIVRSSDPHDELAETRAKLKGILEAVVVP